VPEGAVAKGPEHASVDQTSTACVLFVPAYNEASRILRCLDSMVNQQLPADRVAGMGRVRRGEHGRYGAARRQLGSSP
jgi:hypothetical protein